VFVQRDQRLLAVRGERVGIEAGQGRGHGSSWRMTGSTNGPAADRQHRAVPTWRSRVRIALAQIRLGALRRESSSRAQPPSPAKSSMAALSTENQLPP